MFFFFFFTINTITIINNIIDIVIIINKIVTTIRISTGFDTIRISTGFYIIHICDTDYISIWKILSIQERISILKTIRDRNSGLRVIPGSIIIYTTKCANPLSKYI